MATIVVIPDLYAILVVRNRWLPVNAPPYSLGDDYHYFSLLNMFHRKLLNYFYGFDLLVIPFTAFTRFQIACNIFNLMPYHLGYILFDRRCGILFVRIWNLFWLFCGLLLLEILVFQSFKIPITLSLLVFVATCYFILYPALISLSARSSVIFNLFSVDHIYVRSTPNELTRGFHLGTSAPLLIWSMIPLYWCFVQTPINSVGSVLVISVLTVILFFSYFPIATVYGTLFVFFAGYFISMWTALFVIFLNICLTCCYIASVRNDPVGREILAHLDRGKLLNLNSRKLMEVFAVISFPALVQFFLPSTPPAFLIMFSVTSVFVLGNILMKHQGDRFWIRGSLVIYQLCVLISLSTIIVINSEWYELIFIAGTFGNVLGLLVYLVRNARFLVKTGEKVCPDWISHLSLCPVKTEDSQIIATDSVELSYYIFLFTGHHCLMKNYSIQNLGYRENIKDFCLNFFLAGYKLSNVMSIFDWKVNYSDWVPYRMEILENFHLWSICYIHTLQFIATYREFNNAMNLELYDSEGWTAGMRNLISQSWRGLEEIETGRIRVILSPDRERLDFVFKN